MQVQFNNINLNPYMTTVLNRINNFDGQTKRQSINQVEMKN